LAPAYAPILELYTFSTAEGVLAPAARGFRGGFAARRPVGTFWYFSKSNSKSGMVHAGVDAVEQARTCAGSSAAILPQEFESWLYSKI
jgi:hypothetical protein